ncbi:MAG: OmpA family protein [Candidatus Schekmanbacteria bacterium]|nr:OmpA family protein [Candidatus Schekmanbacteria bacterium]
MDRSATIIGAILLVLVGIAALVGIKLGLSYFSEQERLTTSDAAKIKETIRIAGDNWVGYFGLHSSEFQRRMRSLGIGVEWIDDGARYDERMEKLAAGEYELVVATIDSYLVNAARWKYPGVIVAVIDESKGGDAIVAKEELKSINDLGNPGVKIALTPSSPSDFLLKAASAHFALVRLVGSTDWRVETAGSEEARKLLARGTVQAAVLWEPDVSLALAEPGVHKLLGTEKTKRLIVDVLVAHRKLIAEKPELLGTFVGEYFKAMRAYTVEREKLAEELEDVTGLKSDAVVRMMDGVAWATLEENGRQWFGIATPGLAAEEGLVDAINSTVNILKDHGDFTADPVSGNAYELTYSRIIEDLLQVAAAKEVESRFTVAGSSPQPSKVDFPPLSEEEWAKMHVVGRMKIRPVVFQSGYSVVTVGGKGEVDKAVEALAHYPEFRLLIKGHTAPGGEEESNRALSLDRADAVRRYLTEIHDIDPDRIRTAGVGGAEPLPKEAGESLRAYRVRQPRVEFYLMEQAK